MPITPAAKNAKEREEDTYDVTGRDFDSGFPFSGKRSRLVCGRVCKHSKKVWNSPADYRTYHCCNGNEYAGGCCKYYRSDAAERRNYDRKCGWKQYFEYFYYSRTYGINNKCGNTKVYLVL